MNKIKANNYFVEFKQKGFDSLKKLIIDNNYSSIFIIADSNTKKHCLPVLIKKFSKSIKSELISISPGEENKTINSCQKIWKTLSDKGGDRKSLILNLGGGVITDMGGFIASTFKRGIDFVNIPTTLLSMVDASIGGKTGVDLGAIKNQIGVISNPKLVIIDTEFLKTLSEREFKSGYSEMLKHGLIYDTVYWNNISNILNNGDLSTFIHKSIEIKNNIVLKDPYENRLRKVLNFGHTIGHAIESYFIEADHLIKLTHGEAIAIGMIVEASISVSKCSLKQSEANEIKSIFNSIFSKIKISDQDQENIISLMKFDKKNSHGNINFVLLNSIGEASIDNVVSVDQIKNGFDFYNS
tara:strand:- start:298 stop:1359 length:1062 start_codon:yes stop_codon:yes gene_type:complete